MRCRTMVKEDGINHIVWFGSYGKNILAELQAKWITSDETVISGTVENQLFRLYFSVLSPTTIYFYNEDTIVSSFELTEADTTIFGKLPSPITKIVLTYSDFDPDKRVRLILGEYATAKRTWTPTSEAKKGEEQTNANFSEGINAIADDLTQKLSVMRGELWEAISFGLPLLEKMKSKALIDAAVADIVMKQKNVLGISKFTSDISQKEYHCEIQVQTSIGNIEISI